MAWKLSYMAMAVIRKVEADLWRRCVMNMSKHRKNRVSDVIAWSTGVGGVPYSHGSITADPVATAVYTQPEMPESKANEL